MDMDMDTANVGQDMDVNMDIGGMGVFIQETKGEDRGSWLSRDSERELLVRLERRRGYWWKRSASCVWWCGDFCLDGLIMGYS